MLTWVKCTTLQDDPVLVNLDNVTTLQRNIKASPNYTTIAFIGGITGSSESERDTRANCEREAASQQRSALSGPNVSTLVMVPVAEVDVGRCSERSKATFAIFVTKPKLRPQIVAPLSDFGFASRATPPYQR